MQTIDRSDLVGPLYLHNIHRVERQAEIEEAISTWTSKRTVEEVEKILMEANVPVGSVKEIVKARGAVEDVWVGGAEGWNVKMPGVFPVLEGCGAKTRWAGPNLGSHTEEVLVRDLGLDEAELTRLRENGIIGS